MSYSFVFFIALVIAPLILMLRRAPIWAVFFSVAVVYAAYGIFEFANLKSIQLSLRTNGRSLHDTYYIVSRSQSAFGLSLLFLGGAGVLWVQTKWNALLYGRLTKALFWMLHFGVLGASSATFLLLPMPRRYVDYEDGLETIIHVISWSTFAGWLAFWGLIGLTLWSAIVRLKRPS